MCWKLRIVAIVSGFVVAERATELHFAEAEAVAKTICGAGEPFQFCAALGVEQIELFGAVCEAAEADSEQSHFSFYIAMDSEEFLEHGKNVGIEPRGFSQRFGARVRFKASVADRQRERARGEPASPPTLAPFLGKMTEHGGERIGVAGVFAESVIVRDRLRLRIDHTLASITPPPLPLPPLSPPPYTPSPFFPSPARIPF